jgi:hypothetical protein
MKSKKDEAASKASASAAQAAARAVKPELSDEELLRLYLSLSPKERAEQFVTTARAAKKSGLSPRTILNWIELRAIRAVPVGRKYFVYVNSLEEHLMSRIKRQA